LVALLGGGLYFTIQLRDFNIQLGDEVKRADRAADAAWANQYIAHVNRMESDWEVGNLTRIRETLDFYRKPTPGRKDLRGWEVDYQDRLCNRELRTLTTKDVHGHDVQVLAVAFSPDGTRLASASLDRVRLWNPTTGEEIRSFTLPDKTAGFFSIAFSP